MFLCTNAYGDENKILYCIDNQYERKNKLITKLISLQMCWLTNYYIKRQTYVFVRRSQKSPAVRPCLRGSFFVMYMVFPKMYI